MKRILLFCICLIFIGLVQAQSPQGFKYQTALRDADGLVLANKLVTIKASLLAGSASSTVSYVETHSIATNEYGIANLNIGQGTVVSGVFNTIDWGADTYFLKIELDVNGGNNFVFMGTTQLLSVPYAMYAEKSGSATDVQTISKNGSIITLSKNGGSVTDSDNQTLTLNGNSIGITGGNNIILPTDNDADTTNEIQTINLQGNTLSISKGNSIILSGAVDLDSDPTNEIQNLSLNLDTIKLSKANNIVLPHDADRDSTNELQNLSINNRQISISKRNTINLPIDNDTSAINELQVLSFSNDTLRLSKGNYVILPLSKIVEDMSKIIPVGGCISTLSKISPDGYEYTGVYNRGQTGWEKILPNCSGYTMVQLADTFYLLGMAAVGVNSVYKYVPSSGIISNETTTPNILNQTGSEYIYYSSVDSNIYMFSVLVTSPTALTKVYEYNTITKNWTTKASISKSAAQVDFVFNDKFYIYNGGNGTYYVFDPIANSWTENVTYSFCHGTVGQIFNNEVYSLGIRCNLSTNISTSIYAPADVTNGVVVITTGPMVCFSNSFINIIDLIEGSVDKIATTISPDLHQYFYIGQEIFVRDATSNAFYRYKIGDKYYIHRKL